MSCPVNEGGAPDEPNVCSLLKTMRIRPGMLRQDRQPYSVF
jgi:hypothetical protein